MSPQDLPALDWRFARPTQQKCHNGAEDLPVNATHRRLLRWAEVMRVQPSIELWSIVFYNSL